MAEGRLPPPQADMASFRLMLFTLRSGVVPYIVRGNDYYPDNAIRHLYYLLCVISLPVFTLSFNVPLVPACWQACRIRLFQPPTLDYTTVFKICQVFPRHNLDNYL